MRRSHTDGEGLKGECFTVRSWSRRGWATGSLVGLGLAYATIIGFMLPALRAGENPLAVALFGSVAIMVVILYLADGIVVAGLGVLNDVTITQSSAVQELRRQVPVASRATLFASGMRIAGTTWLA